MRGLHYICGLPRTGSTLLTKILNQNPAIYASTTSPVSVLQRWMRNAVHNTNEFTAFNSEELGEHFIYAVKGMVEGWHHKHKDKIVFDKSRSWISMRNINARTFPNAKYIFCVRDLRAIVASMIKLNSRFPQYCHTMDVQESSVRNNIKMHLDNIDGSPVAGVLNNIIKQGTLNDPDIRDRVHIVRYEDLIATPAKTIAGIYKFTGIEYDVDRLHNFAEIEQGENEHDTAWQGWGEHTIKPSIDCTKINSDMIDILGQENAEYILKEYRWFYDMFYKQ